MQALVVEFEQLPDERLVGLAVGLLDLGIVGIVFGREEAGLGRTDAGQHLLGGVDFGIEAQVFEYLRDESLRVISVVNREIAREANLLRLDA